MILKTTKLTILTYILVIRLLRALTQDMMLVFFLDLNQRFTRLMEEDEGIDFQIQALPYGDLNDL